MAFESHRFWAIYSHLINTFFDYSVGDFKYPSRRQYFWGTHPFRSPLPYEVEVNERIQKLIDKCTNNNQPTVGAGTFPNPIRINSTLDGDELRILPVFNEKRRIGNRLTPLGPEMKSKDHPHDTNKSESNVFVYCVYGTLLMSSSIILVLW